MKYLIIPLMLAGCVSTTVVQEDPELVMPTQTYEVPDPSRGKIIVGVYGFADLTGQRTGTTLSSAVTQGAENYLITGLKDFDNGNWFRVVDRKAIDNLIKERQIIKSANPTFTDQDMPAMLYAGILIEGGIVGYDTNVVSGGDGVRIFGVGSSAKYSQHVVTISLRAVSVATTEVLASVLIQKTIISKSENTTVVAFFDQDTQTVEMESGSNYSEPSNYAVQSAIEKGIYELVIEGKRQNIW